MCKRTFAVFLSVFLTICLMGCGQSKEPVLVESFVLKENYSVENTIPIGEHDSVTFEISPTDVDDSSVELVNNDENVALCLIQDIRLVSGKKIVIVSYRGNAVGETSFYLKDKNGEVKSEAVHVVIVEKEETIDNSRTVYLNYSGDKYHYDYSCAGKSAYESTLNNATKLGKEPCSKCTK